MITSMRTMNDLGAKLDADLTFVSDVFSLASELVENNIPFLAVDNHGGGLLPDHKPFLQIPFTAIEVSLVLRPKPFPFQFLPYASARDTFRISPHNLHDSEMDLARSAGAALLMRGSHRD